MPQESDTLRGYVKTSNMYLGILLALSVGFFGGVLYSSYKSTAIAPAPSGGMPPNAGSSGKMQLSQEQSQTLSALQEATRVTPENAQAWTQLGHFYFDTGMHAKAIESYEKSLALDEKRPDVWTDLGVMYRRNKDPKKAIASFDRALSLNKAHEVALFNKGVVLMHDMNDTTAALNAWEELLQVNPNAKAPNGQPVSTMIAELKKNKPSS